jgi:chemotaxis protein histidine kinase CheA
MAEHAAQVRGTVSVHSAPGQGTELVLLVPDATGLQNAKPVRI